MKVVKEAKELTVAQKAEAALREEREEEAVALLKEKYKELHAAKKMVKNVQREIEDLEEELNDSLDV